MALSWVGRRFGRTNVFGAATAWRRLVRTGRRDEGSWSRSYRRSASSSWRGPGHHESVCEFVEPFVEAVLTPAARGRLLFAPAGGGGTHRERREVDRGNKEKWRTQMGQANRAVVESVAGGLLAELGYEVEVSHDRFHRSRGPGYRRRTRSGSRFPSSASASCRFALTPDSPRRCSLAAPHASAMSRCAGQLGVNPLWERRAGVSSPRGSDFRYGSRRRTRRVPPLAIRPSSNGCAAPRRETRARSTPPRSPTHSARCGAAPLASQCDLLLHELVVGRPSTEARRQRLVHQGDQVASEKWFPHW